MDSAENEEKTVVQLSQEIQGHATAATPIKSHDRMEAIFAHAQRPLLRFVANQLWIFVQEVAQQIHNELNLDQYRFGS